jgi:hypothetical protein
MPWHAKPGCAEYHRPAVECIGNLIPAAWLLPSQSGELFDSLDHCNRRLRSYAFAEGFDIVRRGEENKANPSYRFFCLFHGAKTRNTRKLEVKVKYD